MSLDPLERQAIDSFKTFLKTNKSLLQLISRWGDGEGSYIFQILREELDIPSPEERLPINSRRKRIPDYVRKMVMERDAYRCLHCGGYRDLTLDHIYPASLGGQDMPENLQTLCRPCNSRKGCSHE